MAGKSLVGTHTLSGSSEELKNAGTALPGKLRYLQVRNRNQESWRIGYDSTGTVYLAMGGTDYFEWVPYVNGDTLQDTIYVYGTVGQVLELEYRV